MAMMILRMLSYILHSKPSIKLWPNNIIKKPFENYLFQRVFFIYYSSNFALLDSASLMIASLILSKFIYFSLIYLPLPTSKITEQIVWPIRAVIEAIKGE